MKENILKSCGLSLEQAKIYSYLLTNGLSPAKQISTKSGLGRALTYKLLDQLISLGLIEKRENIAKITLFSPKHPRVIKDMIESKKTNLEHAYLDFSTIFGALSSQFNALSGKPNIQFYEGTDGIRFVYDDILEINQDILVISSPIDEGRQEVLHLIKEQIDKQRVQNIRTKAITPLSDGQKIATPIEDDEKYLLTRKKVPSSKLNIPAQIIIYGDKVAITNFKETITTVLIESKYIAETFKIIFNFIWSESNSNNV